MPKYPNYFLYKLGGDLMAGKCTEKPPRRGPMTVKVKGHTRKGGVKIVPHKRHTPRKK